MQIREEYYIYFEGERVGIYYVYTDGSSLYSYYGPGSVPALAKLGLDKEHRSKKRLRRFTQLMTDENRVPGTRKRVWESGGLRIEFVPRDVDRFWIYRLSAGEGEPGWSEKRYVRPHREGSKPIEGMNEWVSWYCFNKKEDGMFEAELDEAWWWGGGHNDGGTIRREVPEEWLSLPYDEFLENVVTLSAAAYYGFTAEELKEKEGLREFFGFEG